jgi:hypothetical protein
MRNSIKSFGTILNISWETNLHFLRMKIVLKPKLKLKQSALSKLKLVYEIGHQESTFALIMN